VKADAFVWWCYASVRTALPNDTAVWTAVDVGYLEEEGGITDGVVTVRCKMSMSMRYPFWGVETDMDSRSATSLYELGLLVEELREVARASAEEVA